MTIDRVDRLVALCFVITTVATVGMIFDYWQLVYYAIPLLTTVLIVMGCLDRHAAWLPAALMWTVAFGAILLALFTVADITRAGGALLGGLPASTGVFLYLIWPFSTVAAPLLFAWVYHRWLRYDLDADSGERAS